MTEPDRSSRTGIWAPERFWMLLEPLDGFRGFHWNLESAHWSGTIASKNMSWDVEIHGQRYRLTRPGRAGILVSEVASGDSVAFSEPMDRVKGGVVTVRNHEFGFEPRQSEAWQPGELTPRPAYAVHDARGEEMALIRSGTLKPSFEFRVTSGLDDHVAFPLVAIATALAMRMRKANRGGKGKGPRHV